MVVWGLHRRHKPYENENKTFGREGRNIALVCSCRIYVMYFLTSLIILGFTIWSSFCVKTTSSTPLNFLPLKQFGTSHKDYLQPMIDKAEFIGGILHHCKTKMTQYRVLNASMYQKVETSSAGNLVHLLKTHASFLHIGTTKFWQDCVGPLVFNTLLDSNHCKMRELTNWVLLDTFHIKLTLCVYQHLHLTHSRS